MLFRSGAHPQPSCTPKVAALEITKVRLRTRVLQLMGVEIACLRAAEITTFEIADVGPLAHVLERALMKSG